MAEWWSIALGAVVLIASYAATCAIYLFYALLYLLTLAVWPVTALYGVAVVLFAPVIYTVQFAVAPIFIAISLLPRLEALYIFFGCAALVGILAGTTLRITSGVFGSILGIHGMDNNELKGGRVKPGRQSHEGSPSSKRLLEDEHSSQDSDSLWRDGLLERTVTPNTSRRRVPGLLLRETIHEEEDDSL